MRTSERKTKVAVAALLPAWLIAACTDTNAGQRTVFPDSTGFTSTMHSKAGEITDIGFESFYNLTGDPIRLQGAVFVSPPADRLHHLQTRPVQPQAGQDRLHRRRPPGLAVPSHQHHRRHH
jgi:hypothetical protein